MDAQELAGRAREAATSAYAPYSKYRVGAALLTADGSVHLGANVENASYALTVCAERAAVIAAVLSGVREFRAIAVATRDGAAPCGACRQVLMEFSPDMEVVRVDEAGRIETTTLAALLPDAFTPRSVRKR